MVTAALVLPFVEVGEGWCGIRLEGVSSQCVCSGQRAGRRHNRHPRLSGRGVGWIVVGLRRPVTYQLRGHAVGYPAGVMMTPGVGIPTLLFENHQRTSNPHFTKVV